jgi:hypothetical protein
MVTILNTSILTDYGIFSYEKVSLSEAKCLIADGFESAVGHETTAQIISKLLEINCAVNRVVYIQGVDETALIFKLKGRAPEGKILTIAEIETIGYSWGVLTRTA